MVFQHLPDGSYLSRLDGLERRIAGAKVVMTGADGTRIADSYRLITTLTDHRVYPAEALARLYYERRVWISSPMGGCGAALVKVMLACQSCWSTRAGATVGSGVGRRAEPVEELDVTDTEQYQVVIVGAGFAGIACAKELAKHDIRVVVIDRNNYHQFQPLLYQVATAQLGVGDIARSLRGIFAKDHSVSVKTAAVVSVDPATHTVTTADGTRYTGEVLVLAPGAQPNFFGTPGAAEHSFPLYSVVGALRLREHTLSLLDAVSRDRSYLDKGALTFVVVGAGPTGVETSGALSELVRNIIPHFYRDVPCELAQVHLVDLGHVVLNGFSDRAHAYAAGRLEKDGVQIHLGVGVAEIGPGHVRLADGTHFETRTVVWGGGEMAAPLLAAAGLAQGRGGRIDVNPDLTVPGVDGVYVLGDAANIAGPDGKPFPQLGSVAQQSGGWAAKNIEADLAGKSRKPFHYHDKGIMAMIGRNAAVAEMGKHRHEVDGPLGFAAWLGVHAMLLSGVREKTDAFMKWGWEYVSNSRPDSLIESRSSAAIDWDDDGHKESDEPPNLPDADEPAPRAATG